MQVSRDGRRARRLVGVLLAAFATLAVLAMVAEGTLLGVDHAVQDAAIASREGWLDNTMVLLTLLGTRWVIGALTIGIVAWALLTGRCRAAVTVLVIAVLLNPVLEFGFKELVGRVRPNVAQLLPGRGPSFPSGHVLASTGFYGLLPFLAWETTTRYWIRRAVFFLSVGVVVAVTVSRIYLDVH